MYSPTQHLSRRQIFPEIFNKMNTDIKFEQFIDYSLLTSSENYPEVEVVISKEDFVNNPYLWGNIYRNKYMHSDDKFVFVDSEDIKAAEDKCLRKISPVEIEIIKKIHNF